MRVDQLKKLLENVPDDFQVLGCGVIESGRSVCGGTTTELDVKTYDEYVYTEDGVPQTEHNVLVITVSVQSEWNE